MHSASARFGVSLFAALTPAALGAVLFARLLATGYDLRLPSAMLIGVACGAMGIAATGSRGAAAALGGVLAALVGVLLAFLLDAKWNSVAQVAEEMMTRHGIAKDVARQQARTILGGSSLWELVQDRLDLVGWATPAFAALAAAAVSRSRAGHWLLRIRPRS